MVSNRVEQNHLKYLAQQNPGKAITSDQLSATKVKAAQAAFRTQLQNFGIIYLSNKVCFKRSLLEVGEEDIRIYQKKYLELIH